MSSHISYSKLEKKYILLIFVIKSVQLEVPMMFTMHSATPLRLCSTKSPRLKNSERVILISIQKENVTMS